MSVVDASVWVSRFVPEDEHHAASRYLLRPYIRGEERVILPVLVLPEVAGAVSRRTGRADLGRQTAAEILRLPNLHLVQLTVALAEDVASIAAVHGLRGADAVYVAVARDFNLPLVTFDHDMAARARHIVRVVGR